MNKKIVILIGAVIALIVAGISVAAVGDNGKSPGPAPNSGDGIPDGSGFAPPQGPGNGPGPAPNSGDGIPDGPGW